MTSAWRVLFLVGATAAAAAPPLDVGVAPGPHAVGFRVRQAADATRHHAGGARPVQVGCWYPAEPGSGAALVYGDYVALSGVETRAEPAAAAKRDEVLRNYRSLLVDNGVDGAAVDTWLGRPVRARAEAAAARGRWPLVLVAQGYFHSLHHQALLAEWLASRGAVVCSTPSQARLDGPMQSEADVFPHADAQARDLALAGVVARELGAEGPAELVGHSFGARSALLLAARQPARALVSLDGGIGAAEARGWITRATEIDPARLALPILHVYESGDPALTPDFRLIESLARAPRWLLRADGLRHVHFTSYGAAVAALPALEPSADPALPARLQAVARAVAAFLESTRAGAPRVEPPSTDSGLALRALPAS